MRFLPCIVVEWENEDSWPLLRIIPILVWPGCTGQIRAPAVHSQNWALIQTCAGLYLKSLTLFRHVVQLEMLTTYIVYQNYKFWSQFRGRTKSFSRSKCAFLLGEGGGKVGFCLDALITWGERNGNHCTQYVFVHDGWVLEIILNDFEAGKSITRAIGRSGPWKSRLYIYNYFNLTLRYSEGGSTTHKTSLHLHFIFYPTAASYVQSHLPSHLGCRYIWELVLGRNHSSA